MSSHGMKPIVTTRTPVLIWLALLILPFVVEQAAPASSENIVVQLCDHIMKNRQKMFVDTNQTELVWSDGAILEIGTNFPTQLQKLICSPSRYQDIQEFLRKLDARR